MEQRKLGNTDINVSAICLGTMTFGEQNTPDDGYEQMAYAVDQGINFFDTAELYAIPPSAATYGKTEEIVGEWLKASGKRKDIILASKVVGPAPRLPWIREGKAALDRENMEAALEGSLRRLQTDYIDLYQIHWPQRAVNSFGRRGFREQEISGQESEKILEALEVLTGFIKEGKVRTIGLSNETAWGVMTFLKHHAVKDLPRIVSVQNPYNLLDRTFEVNLAEMAMQEQTGLLAYSPLAGGGLTGKYLNGKIPKGSRRDIDSRASRYAKPHVEAIVQDYVDLAKKYSLDAAQMALAFINQQPFVTSNIIGATKMEQLKTNISSIDIKLTEEMVLDINKIHSLNPNPCP